ncbi:MAG TPA: gluconokinase [Microbacterium sp.]|nr:gluconokinase [Microbacterium sp.]
MHLHEAGGPPSVIVVMGVSGSGKSTAAGLLAERLGWEMQEGDDLHPRANVEKMAAGHPLTDEDRWPWLSLIADWIDVHLAEGTGGVITCSALKRRYRDVLARPGVAFAHIAGTRDVVSGRIGGREGHFMPASLLASQYEALEPLQPDENGVVIDANQPPQAEVDEIVAALFGSGR